jgi:hypothetical protein
MYHLPKPIPNPQHQFVRAIWTTESVEVFCLLDLSIVIRVLHNRSWRPCQDELAVNGILSFIVCYHQICVTVTGPQF